jgi:hypothetical protein
MAELPVCASLANLSKAETLQRPNHLPRFENRQTRHRVSNSNRLRADKFRFEAWISVLEQHGYNLPEILSQLVERRPLRVRSSPSWNIADKNTRIRIAFDNRCKTPHEQHLKRQVSGRQPTPLFHSLRDSFPRSFHSNLALQASRGVPRGFFEKLKSKSADQMLVLIALQNLTSSSVPAIHKAIVGVS